MVKKESGLRLAVLLLTLFLCVGCFIGLGNEQVFAAEVVDSGSMNGWCSWELDSDGLLRIFSYDSSFPKKSFYSDSQDLIKKIVVEDRLTPIGNYGYQMFAFLTNCTEMDLSNLDTSTINGMAAMFMGCSSLTKLDISGWDTSNVTNMYNMFSRCSGLTELDISSFDTSNVTDMEGMFNDCTSLKTIYVSPLWDTSSVTVPEWSMFENCSNLVGAVAYDSSKTDATMANYETGYLTLKSASNNDTGSGASSTYQSGIDEVTATIAVTGVEDCTTVKAYQLVKGYYEKTADGEYNLIRYDLADSVYGKISNLEHPTASEIATIAMNIGKGNFDGKVIAMNDSGSGNYSAEVEPGLYMILVTGSTDTVYNPALIAVNVTDANSVDGTKITSGSISMDNAFNTNGTTAYIKRSKSSMNKTIIMDDGNTVLGNTAAVGDIIHFKLDGMTIPSFSGNYEHPVYRISDTLESGKFEAISNLKVSVNGTEVASDAGVYEITYGENNSSFVISFTESYLKAHAADAVRPAVEITYDSKLTTDAGVNYAENYNHAKLEYSNNPDNETSLKEIVKNTYHYTFAIDGLLDGEANNDKNNEFNKVTQAGGMYEGKKSQYALAGAEFTLYSDEDCANALATCITDENGHLLFSGLDAGTYYIRETKAPKTYALNDNLYKVVIVATMDSETGIMTQYSVNTQVKTVGDSDWVDAGSVAYRNTISEDTVQADGSVVNDIVTMQTTVTEIINTRIATLPSTGGAGTMMAFAVSAGLACTTGGIVILGKKKSKEQ